MESVSQHIFVLRVPHARRARVLCSFDFEVTSFHISRLVAVLSHPVRAFLMPAPA
jgi:hypothetical protein